VKPRAVIVPRINGTVHCIIQGRRISALCVIVCVCMCVCHAPFPDTLTALAPRSTAHLQQMTTHTNTKAHYPRAYTEQAPTPKAKPFVASMPSRSHFSLHQPTEQAPSLHQPTEQAPTSKAKPFVASMPSRSQSLEPCSSQAARALSKSTSKTVSRSPPVWRTMGTAKVTHTHKYIPISCLCGARWAQRK